MNVISVVTIPCRVISFSGRAFFRLEKLITPTAPPASTGSLGLLIFKYILNGLPAISNDNFFRFSCVESTGPPGLLTFRSILI